MSSRRQRSNQLGGRYRQVSLYFSMRQEKSGGTNIIIRWCCTDQNCHLSSYHITLKWRHSAVNASHSTGHLTIKMTRLLINVFLFSHKLCTCNKIRSTIITAPRKRQKITAPTTTVLINSWFRHITHQTSTLRISECNFLTESFAVTEFGTLISNYIHTKESGINTQPVLNLECGLQKPKHEL